jgi:hypothetical protein
MIFHFVRDGGEGQERLGGGGGREGAPRLASFKPLRLMSDLCHTHPCPPPKSHSPHTTHPALRDRQARASAAGNPRHSLTGTHCTCLGGRGRVVRVGSAGGYSWSFMASREPGATKTILHLSSSSLPAHTHTHTNITTGETQERAEMRAQHQRWRTENGQQGFRADSRGSGRTGCVCSTGRSRDGGPRLFRYFSGHMLGSFEYFLPWCP